MGPSPSGRFGHAMACDGTRVFVLGGELSPGAQEDETKLIHVLDPSMNFLFVDLFGQPLSLKTQITSITRNPNPTLSIPARRPPNSCGSHRRVPRPKDSHISRHLRRMPRQHMVLLLFKPLSQKNWITPPPSRLLASNMNCRRTRRKQRSMQDWSNVNCRRSLTDCCCLATRHSSRLKALCRKPHSAQLKPTRTSRGACQARGEGVRTGGTPFTTHRRGGWLGQEQGRGRHIACRDSSCGRPR
jgi:hypothetical protein